MVDGKDIVSNHNRADDLIVEVFITSTSSFIGKTVNVAMGSLGVAPSRLVKIRRNVNNKNIKEDLESKPKTPFKDFVNQVASGVKQVASDVETKVKSVWQTEQVPTEQEAQDLKDAFDADEFIDIISPDFSDLLGARDIIYISSAQDTMEKMMKSIAGESKGLLILKREALSFEGFGHELVECVISDRNPFLNKKVSELSALFKERYNVGLVTVRAKEWSSVEEAEIGADPAMDFPVIHKETFTSEAEYTLVTKAEDEKIDQIETGLEMSVRIHAKEDHHKEEVLQQAEELVANMTITGSDHILSYGDVAFVVADEKHLQEMSQSRDRKSVV
jgi:hypothetical protein